MKKILKIIAIISFAFVAAVMMTLPTVAEEIDGYKEFINSIPSDIEKQLPDAMYSDSIEDIAHGVKEISGIKFLLKEISRCLFSGLNDALPYAVTVLGMLVISSLARIISNSFSPDSGALMESVCSLCVFGAVITGSIGCIEKVNEYFDNLIALASSYIPLSGALYSMGGNIATAVSSSASFGIVLTLCELIMTYTVIPVFCFCLCIALCSSFERSQALLTIGGIVKKNYIFILSLIMAILSVSISAQTFISAKADNFTMRGAKFVISSFIPHFGGSVSQSLGSVATSVELLRGAVGIGGVIIILLMLIPTVVEIAIIRLIYSVCASVAGMLGCNAESGLLGEISSLYGYLFSVSAICSSVFIISFGLLARCASAVG